MKKNDSDQQRNKETRLLDHIRIVQFLTEKKFYQNLIFLNQFENIIEMKAKIQFQMHHINTQIKRKSNFNKNLIK